MPYAETNQGPIFYTLSQIPQTPKEEREAGIIPSLVLVHGAGGTRLHWPARLRRLPDATVYTLDLPGHGRSGVQGGKTIESYANTVASFVRTVGAEQSIIVGHSMGGAIALTMALNHSGWVGGLVLIASGARLRVSPSILAKIGEDFEDSVELITRLAWAQDTPSTLTQRGRDALLETGSDVLWDDLSACDRFDVTGRLEEITHPTLVIAGTADQLTPAKYGRFLTKNLPNAQLVLVEGAGHMVMLERPAETAKAVQEFVGKQV